MLAAPTEHRTGITIVGAGFGGLGLAARLTEQGREDFVVFDAADGVGGTWWANRYPGCACDVPSHLYSLSFFPNPDWTRRFAPRAEIQAYLQRLVEHYRLQPRLRLSTGIEQARWDPGNRCWRLLDSHGRKWRTDRLVWASGGLSRPKWPGIDGLDTFSGQVVHSSQWHDGIETADRRVAVIGTGASAAQLVPEIARNAARLDVYQRSPHWILPRPDRAIGPRRRALYRRVPSLQKLARLGIWLISEARVPGLRWSTRLAAGHRLLARIHLRRQVPDPALRAALTPDFDIGCKRVILSSDFYPALVRESTELISRPIARIEPDAIVDADEQRRPTDLIVLATGFHATDPIPSGLLIGRNGLDLGERWRDGAEAWAGVMVHGFPNLFLLMGPNTALGHNSVLLMIEAQIGFILRALAQSESQPLEVPEAMQRDYNDWLQQRLAGTVWNTGGCSSWYLHPETGRNTTLWPGFTWQYRRMMRRLKSPA
jgi:cation diffusion facilitator CzcD-associated flavoprotein CzcO